MNEVTEFFRFLVSWPPRVLSPNARAHWRTKHGTARLHKTEACYAARSAMGKLKANPESVTVELIFHPPDKRSRDIDNMLASMKAALDGVVIALDVDDSKWSIMMHKGEPVKHGKVEIVVSWLQP